MPVGHSTVQFLNSGCRAFLHLFIVSPLLTFKSENTMHEKNSNAQKFYQAFGTRFRQPGRYYRKYKETDG